jgi:hypothetical protein
VDALLPLLEPSEALELEPLPCDDACCTEGDAGDSVEDTETLLPCCDDPVCLLSTDGSALDDEDDVGLVGTPALAATTAAFGGLAELKKRPPPPDLDEK